MNLATASLRSLATAGCLLLLAGCQSTGTEGQRQADELSQRVDAYAKSMTQAKTEFEALLASHDKLVTATTGDLNAMYGDFQRNLATMENRRTTMRQQREQLRATAQQYFANWQAQAAQITNEDLREKSAERMKETQERYEQIHSVVEKGIQAYEPILAQLKDHAQYLSVELNFEAANSLQRNAGKVRSASEDVVEAADAVIAAADNYVKAAAARAEPPPPPPTQTDKQ